MSDSKWYYAEGRERRGPVEENDMRDMARSGLIREDTLVWVSGMDDWQPASNVLPDELRPDHWAGTASAPPAVNKTEPEAYRKESFEKSTVPANEKGTEKHDPDTFPGAIKTCFRKYTDFKGRARRPEYWWFTLFIMIGSFVASIVDAFIFGAGSEIAIIGAAFYLAILLPSLAVAIRRLHDTDRSGWWLLISFIPLIGFIVLIFFMASPGTDGENRFGPPPR